MDSQRELQLVGKFFYCPNYILSEELSLSWKGGIEF
jgi:hypothetical protein